MSTLTIGTRGSTLALTQTHLVVAALSAAHPDLEVHITIISTKGDRVLDVTLSKIGDKGLFVKELETALLQGEIDLAVHSAKDLPSAVPDGLSLAAFLQRGDPRDGVVMRASSKRADGEDGITTLRQYLPHGARVGTSSLRRICQLRALRPDLRITDVRGNVDTRLRKLAEGQFDAIVLAMAGLERLGFVDVAEDGKLTRVRFDGADLSALPLPMTMMLPAVAQGTLAIETRSADIRTQALVCTLNDAVTETTALAERSFLRRLEGGCQMPIAAFAQVNDRNRLHLTGLVGSLDGMRMLRRESVDTVANATDAERVGLALADELIAHGASDILSGAQVLAAPALASTLASTFASY